MADVIRFVSVNERELREVALQLIEELGASAGLQLMLLARSRRLPASMRERLLAVADIIEGEQGFSWYVADEAEAASCASQ